MHHILLTIAFVSGCIGILALIAAALTPAQWTWPGRGHRCARCSGPAEPTAAVCPKCDT